MSNSSLRKQEEVAGEGNRVQGSSEIGQTEGTW